MQGRAGGAGATDSMRPAASGSLDGTTSGEAAIPFTFPDQGDVPLPPASPGRGRPLEQCARRRHRRRPAAPPRPVELSMRDAARETWRRSVNRVVALGLGIALWGIAVGAEAQERITRLSLDEAVSLAARENPALRAKEFERQAVSADEITAGLRPNPTARSWARSSSAGRTQGRRDARPWRSTRSSRIRPIELGGKRGRRIDSARAATRVTGYELDDVRRQIVFLVKKAFTDGLTARDSLALAETEPELARRGRAHPARPGRAGRHLRAGAAAHPGPALRASSATRSTRDRRSGRRRSRCGRP